MEGIEAFGWYLPRYAISAEAYREAWGRFAGRGIQEKAVVGYDEDETTMAVEAAGRAVEAATPETVAFLAFASSGTTPAAATVAEALGLRRVRTVDLLGTTNAGLAALLVARDVVAAREGVRALAVAADAPRASPDDPTEHPLGAGAAAFLLGPNGSAVLEAHGAAVRETYGEDVRDERGLRRRVGTVDMAAAVMGEAAEELRSKLGRKKVHRAVVPDANPRLPARVAGPWVAEDGLETGLARRVGDAGAAAPLLGLVRAFGSARRGERWIVVSYGRGAATALALGLRRRPAGDALDLDAFAARRVLLTYVEYLQHRRVLATPGTVPAVSQGAYVSLPTYLATVAARYRLVGQRCAACGAVRFPPGERCDRCGGRALEDAPLRRGGTVHACTTVGRGAAPTEFAEQQAMLGEYVTALIDLDDGPRVMAQLTDCTPKDVAIGTRVEMVFRRLYVQEGVLRYGFKFRPVESARAGSAPA